MKDVIEDLYKIYTGLIDCNNIKIYNNLNPKYTVVDKTMLTTYLYMRLLKDNQIEDNLAKEKIMNYLLESTVYDEKEYVEIAEDNRKDAYNKAIKNVIKDKFKYKNRILTKIKYKYEITEPKMDYDNLILFFEDLADLFIFLDLYSGGKKEAYDRIQTLIAKMDSKWTSRENFENEDIYNEVVEIINSIKETEDLTDRDYKVSNYFRLSNIVFELRNRYKFLTATQVIKENYLFHSYLLTITSMLIVDYLEGTGEQIDKFEVFSKALFYNFAKYSGNRIKDRVNDELSEIAQDQDGDIADKLRVNVGEAIYGLVEASRQEADGFFVGIMDLITRKMKIWYEVGYMNNYSAVKLLTKMGYEEFKVFYSNNMMIDKFKNKNFIKNIILQMYIYIKKNVMSTGEKVVLRYLTEEEYISTNDEIEELERKLY